MTSVERKFCTGCQTMRPLSEGSIVQRGKMKRWICVVCQDRKNVSPYATKAKREQREAA